MVATAFRTSHKGYRSESGDISFEGIHFSGGVGNGNFLLNTDTQYDVCWANITITDPNTEASRQFTIVVEQLVNTRQNAPFNSSTLFSDLFELRKENGIVNMATNFNDENIVAS